MSLWSLRLSGSFLHPTFPTDLNIWSCLYCADVSSFKMLLKISENHSLDTNRFSSFRPHTVDKNFGLEATCNVVLFKFYGNHHCIMSSGWHQHNKTKNTELLESGILLVGNIHDLTYGTCVIGSKLFSSFMFCWE